MSKLILAEKPSVARNIASALECKVRKDGYIEGNGYLITWAFGHLLELYDCKDYDPKMKFWRMEHFPYIPETFKYKVKSNPKNKDKPDAGVYKQLKIIDSLIKRDDVTEIISAVDYDREGELISILIWDYLRVKKPIYRLLINEWTKEEIHRGMNQLKTNKEMKRLQDAGLSRQLADWVIGINFTSVTTLKYAQGKGNVLNVGRVLLPTLKIIYDRDKEIEKFVPKDYHKLKAKFINDTATYEGIYFEGKTDKFNDKEKLKEISREIKNKKGEIIKKKKERKKQYPPFLFNLSNLQGFITSKYNGWTSDKVLKVAQALYEKKFITYPRTASIALEESLKDRAKKVLNALKKGLSYEKEIKFSTSSRIFNNKKVESHSAIIPTYVIPKKLTEDEKKVYSTIKDRFIAQFMAPAEFDHTEIITKVETRDENRLFISKGKILVKEGWRKIEGTNSKDELLPNVEKGQIVTVNSAEVESKKTKPPTKHTEKTLLKVMENCGKKVLEGDREEMLQSILSGYSIGTPATRADTIKRLKKIGYIATKGKSLYATEKGIKLVETFPIKELFDLDYTGRLEKALSDIEKGKLNKEEFLKHIFSFTIDGVKKILNDKNNVIADTLNSVNTIKKDMDILGKCPECGHDVIEGKKGFGCSNWTNGCKFVVWKNDRYLASMKKKVTKTMVKKLLSNKKVKIKGLTSKKGNKFDAILYYEKNQENNYYSWKMEFEK
ncbi:DNA topoisomerase [Paramaledivibacter caminithermalis]|jgi:DNA topoisomerase-3|uniref:DNA topoisomerase n=1 Tax=Paramaledivibacter caminithermalis (strain DSM 15212 / CIP 107654 / DViRD3) TaxID=1121301 RepID=A0A1M6R7D4_PARC5|nr:DNA topoisomerase [Paramaledivibacter caminithermalis]SHK28227.1 DNA topoisomerase-3 [Paramaledivibacter caminithermalis DSM 15212]